MAHGLTITVQPSTEPVTLAEQKVFSRVNVNAFDSLLNTAISSSRHLFETLTNRAIIATTFKLTLSEWLNPIVLPRGVASSVSSVKYYDEDNTQQTVNSSLYWADVSQEPALIHFNSDFEYPTLGERTPPIEVVFVAGWSSVPDVVKTACMLQANLFFQDPSADVHEGFKAIAKLYEIKVGEWHV